MNIAKRIRELGLAGAAAAVLVWAPDAIAQQPAESQATSVQKFQQKVQDKIEERKDAEARQGFSVVLLLGDMQPADGTDTIPAATRRALVDMKDFLPYKSYRLLDTQWTLCCGTTSSAITRLRGVENQEYELELRSNYEGVDRLAVRFLLRDAMDAQLSRSSTKDGSKDGDGASTGPSERLIADLNREIFGLERERLDLNVQVTQLRKGVDVGTKDPAELKRVDVQLQAITNRINALKAQVASSSSSSKFVSRPVIDTSFRMDIGETVVVGTSGLKGGTRALIALLTAVPTKAKTR
jgi:hypothetical protein